MKLSPKIKFSGVTVVLSNPSRFDKGDLLTGAKVSEHFKKECFADQGINIMSAEVRLKEDKSPLRDGTKVLLLLGKDAIDDWTLGATKDNRLGEIRGAPYEIKTPSGQTVVGIPSYLPQDAVDMQDYESEHNELLVSHEALGEEKEPEGGEKRRHGVTARSNWRFWLKKDCAKAFRILANDGKVPPRPFEPTYRIWPTADEIIQRLTETKNEEIFLDIETDSNLSITCCGLGFCDNTVYVVPFVDHCYRRAYPHLTHILRALSIALRSNTIVAHNGAAFDFFVLAHKYKLAIGWQVYDTMLAQHRCFPEVEKSLGHCTSLWTYEPFHKDESCFFFTTPEQLNQLMRYCGKDVYTMMLVKRAIDAYATKIPGLSASIAQVNESIRPYLTMTLQGIHFRDDLRTEIMAENDRIMTQCVRMSNILVGGNTVSSLGRKSKTSLLASPAKCVEYFHEMLDYPVVGRSKKTGEPSLGKKNIYKLRLKVENPVLDLCLAYRETAKESGSLKFTPWKDKDGQLGVEKEEE